MSQQNVEIVRRIYELFNRRDDAALNKLIAGDATLRLLDWGPFPKPTFVGWEATREYWEDIFAAVADFRMEPEAVVGEGDYVVATIHTTGRGASSGVEVNMRFAVLAEIRDTKLVRFDVFATRAEALEAAGLSE